MGGPYGPIPIFVAMNWTPQADLTPYNTFGLGAKAQHFGRFESVQELRDALIEIGQSPMMVLGGGSNMLLTADFDGYILRNEIRGIEILSEDEATAMVRVGGGEVWHDFVLWCIAQDLGGVENLSLIPGSVGAAPIQNIGAYGVELESVFESCSAIELANGNVREFSPAECDFGYRWSVFKGPLKGKYVITSVTFRLTKNPEVNTSYGAISAQLETMGVQGTPSIREVSDAVIAIRESKLPNPAEIGNSGSFFKNPIVDGEKHAALKAEFPELVSYRAEGTSHKIAAGWMIDYLGWKGYRKGDAGVHARQALVLVNYGGATGVEIAQLAREIQDDVSAKFGIELEAEVNFIGAHGPL